MPERTYPAPLVDPTTQPFWDAARRGELLIGLCRETGMHFWYPRGVSPFTLSTDVELVPAKGTGTVYSYTVMRVGQSYIAAYVELDEGPRLFTNVVDCAPEAVRIGMRVRVAFRPTEGDGPPVPVFRPE
ncbi:MAG TPA: OB-fold domain-containing protein [Acetobacteraceae bacterium]|jgi:hypothetical protein|nr:OB-fold domain-containing protein [Acetobacteraceae bacterium]